MSWIHSFRSYFMTVHRLFAYLWKIRLWWLIPFVVVVLILALITILAMSTPLGPFIYAIF